MLYHAINCSYPSFFLPVFEKDGEHVIQCVGEKHNIVGYEVIGDKHQYGELENCDMPIPQIGDNCVYLFMMGKSYYICGTYPNFKKNLQELYGAIPDGIGKMNAAIFLENQEEYKVQCGLISERMKLLNPEVAKDFEKQSKWILEKMKEGNK